MQQILVVDDSSGIRHQVSEFLAQNGYQVLTAEDGLSGLEQMKANPDIRLVIADVNMPEMDGLTMVQKIRNELKNSKVHVLMLTTETKPELKEKAREVGVRGWLVKPFNSMGTLAIIRKLLAETAP